MTSKLVWITPSAGEVITYCARVSNPSKQGEPSDKLLKYMVEHKHWSPFEMASMCIEINTTRTIARQILRHRSFSFQEFSQRYADVSDMNVGVILGEARLQDEKNRQSSLLTDDDNIKELWYEAQKEVARLVNFYYKEALKAGIAKEVARNILPEGMTPSRMYVSGTIRSWIHYCQLRVGNGTQLEHQEIAKECKEILLKELPILKICLD